MSDRCVLAADPSRNLPVNIPQMLFIFAPHLFSTIDTIKGIRTPRADEQELILRSSKQTTLNGDVEPL